MEDHSPVPTEIEEARRELRALREKLGLAGGGILIGGLLAQALGSPLVLPAVLVGLGVVVTLYFVPPTSRGQEARRVLSQWEERHGRDSLTGGGEDDARIRAAEALVRRICDHTGGRSRSSDAAQDLLQNLYDRQDDLRAIEELRSVKAKQYRRDLFTRRAAALEAQVRRRMDDSLDAIAEIFEAILAQDEENLRTVLGRVNDELHRLKAEMEVQALIDPESSHGVR